MPERGRLVKMLTSACAVSYSVICPPSALMCLVSAVKAASRAWVMCAAAAPVAARGAAVSLE